MDIIKGVRALGLPVHVRGCRGNHGRQNKYAPMENNYDFIVMQMLRMLSYYEDPTGTSVEYATTTPYLNFKIKGWNIHLRHEAPVQTETPAARAKFGGWKAIHDFDVMVYGHRHHPGNGTYLDCDTVMNGAPMGIDDLAESMGTYSRPSQVLFGMSPDQGFSFKYNVYLDRFGCGGELQYLIERYPALFKECIMN
ncbi:MAG: hypothetical protein HZB23_15490 [Deltaproteobacteria bacterium]|nr:hypothetical protein [Deltaproteobacteria bacterium]